MPLAPEGRPPIHADAIAAGEYPIDSMPARKRQPGDTVILEGYLGMMRDITRPYQIPYGIIVPRDIDGLLVPVPASTTHLAFSSIRLEPTWMTLGQAAGVAAHLAIAADAPVSKVNVEKMQRILLEQGQVLTYFKDLDPADPAFAAMQFLGTKGLFHDYNARSKDPLEYTEAVTWLTELSSELKLKPQTGRWLRRREMRILFPGQDSIWTDPGNTARGPDDPVLRGEFCRAIYESLRGR